MKFIDYITKYETKIMQYIQYVLIFAAVAFVMHGRYQSYKNMTHTTYEKQSQIVHRKIIHDAARLQRTKF